jgi:hypothetical protein
LRQASESIAKADLWLYEPAPALRLHGSDEKESPTAGTNAPVGAYLYIKTKEKPKKAELEILDSDNKVVRRYSSEVNNYNTEQLDPEDDKPKKQLELKAGLNRFVWDLRYADAPRVNDYYLYEYEDGSHGPIALPGKYQARLTIDGQMLTQPVEVKPDPRSKATQAELKQQFDMLIQIREELADVYGLASEVIDVRKQIADLKTRVDPVSAKGMLEEGQALDERLGALQEKLINLKVRANEDSLKFGLGVDGSLADLAMIVGGDADDVPTEASRRQFGKLKDEVAGYHQRWAEIVKTDVPKFEQAAEKQNVHVLVVKGQN